MIELIVAMIRESNMPKRKPRAARPPMLVMRQLVNIDLEAKELVAVRAFEWGVATKTHYDLLLDLANMLLVAGHTDKSREYAIAYVDDRVFPTLRSIKARYDRTGGKLGVTAQERDTLVMLVEYSKQFWARQPIELYKDCADELQAYYTSLVDDQMIEFKVAA